MSDFHFSIAKDMAQEWGDRFNGWFLSKSFIEKKNILLNYKDTDLSYSFIITDFNFRFIMPPEIRLRDGFISYTEAERVLGVFRFPRNENGDFVVPNKSINISSEENLTNILSKKGPLVFEPFKIPQYGFRYTDINDWDFNEIESFTDKEFVECLRKEYDKIIEQKFIEVREKILNYCNILLILKNVLNRNWKNIEEASYATDKIIHI